MYATIDTIQSTRRAIEWINALEDTLSSRRILLPIYGPDVSLEPKRTLLLSALNRYLERFGDGPVVVSRAPGRINIMGRHVDHQGGFVNMMALERDFWLVAGPAAEGRVHLANID